VFGERVSERVQEKGDADDSYPIQWFFNFSNEAALILERQFPSLAIIRSLAETC
jgi:hypothetical protein